MIGVQLVIGKEISQHITILFSEKICLNYATDSMTDSVTSM